MDIDLSKVIGYSRDSLQSRALMRSIMLDLYPGKTREMNVLLDVYESGVPRKIKNDGNITDAKYAQYIQKIVDDYGMQEQWAVVGLNAWIDVCLGNGTAATIKYKVATVSSNGGNISNANVVGGGYTNPIVHNNIGGNVPVVVKGSASDYEIKDLGNGKAELTKYKGFDIEDTLVPNEVNGIRIVGIGEDAYKSCIGIKRLIIPEGIEYIKDGAFDGCSSLIEVTFPTTLKQLGTKDDGWGKGVFSSTKITSINLPNGLKSIGHNAFGYCSELASVQLPDNIQIIGSHAFYSCPKLKKIAFPNSLKRVLNSAFEDCRTLSIVQMNEGLLEIGAEAFKGCTSIQKMIIPSTVSLFGKDIFNRGYGASSLVAICYPGSKAIEYCRVNRITIETAVAVNHDASAFANASANVIPINHVPINTNGPSVQANASNASDYEIADLGNGKAELVKYKGFDVEDTLVPSEINGKKIIGIGEDAYKSCLGIKRLIIPEGIQYIKDGAFDGCSSLIEVTLPTTLIQLGTKDDGWGKGVFSSTKITSINLPNGLKSIGHNAFGYCNELCQVQLPDDIQIIGSHAFYNCSKLKNIVFPNSVKKVMNSAFEDCSTLSVVQLNEGLIELGAEAFKGCKCIQKITLPSTLSVLGKDIFNRGYGASSLVVRCYPGSKAIEYCRINKIGIENAKA